MLPAPFIAGQACRAEHQREGEDQFILHEHLIRMKHHLGIALQFAALVFLPMLIIWQLEFGFRLIVMPALTLVAVVVFYVGYRLRES